MGDRFGDYGLVGVLVYGMGTESLEIDTFLLSCRVLGRGVEHRMLNYLGDIARQRGLDSVVATVIPTGKNLPARQFLDSVAIAFKEDLEGKAVYRVPAEFATSTTLSSEVTTAQAADDPEPSSPLLTAGLPAAWSRLTSESQGPCTVPIRCFFSLRRKGDERRERPCAGPVRPALPSTDIEHRLSKLWADLLRLETVGVRDNYFDLGGTSLLAVDLFARDRGSLWNHAPADRSSRLPPSRSCPV